MQVELSINSLKVSTILGVTDEERSYPQVIELNIIAWYEIDEALDRKSIESVPDYSEIVSAIKLMCNKGSWQLMENLCYELAAEIFKGFQIINRLEVHVKKRILPEIESSAVRLNVTREEISL